MGPNDDRRTRFGRGLRLPALLTLLALLLGACTTVTVTTDVGEVTFIICDYLDFPVAGVLVEIGGVTRTTGVDGRAVIPNVDRSDYTANIYDALNDTLYSFYRISGDEVAFKLPTSNAGTRDSSATIAGSYDTLVGNPDYFQVGAAVQGRPFAANVDSTGLNYDVQALWKGSEPATADVYGFDISYNPLAGFSPGFAVDLAVAYEGLELRGGESLTADLTPLSHAATSVPATSFGPAGFDHVQRELFSVIGSTSMDFGVDFSYQWNDNPAPTFDLTLLQVPNGWTFSAGVIDRYSNADGETAFVSQQLSDADVAAFEVRFAANLGSAILPVADGGTVEVGDSFSLGTLPQGASASLRFDAVDAGDLSVNILTGRNNAAFPSQASLSALGLAIPNGTAYRVRSIRYDWSIEAFFAKLAGFDVFVSGTSSRGGLSSIYSREIDVTVGENGGPGPGPGGTPPTIPTFFDIGLYELPEGLFVVFESFAPLLRTQASSCPQVSIAATGGTALIDACSGDVIQSYDNLGQTYFDAVIMPIPPGETGNASLFQTGLNYFLAALEEDGSLVGFGQVNASGGPFIDSNPIGDDASLGVAYVNAALASIGFTTFDGTTGFWTFDDTTLQPSDLNDGLSDNWARSAIVNPARDAMLVVANRLGSGMQLLHVELDGPIGPGPQAVTSVSIVGPLGSDPRRIRCDFASERCAISDRLDNTLTIVDWDGSSAPSITDTASVADGPVGIDVLGDRVVSAGYDDDQFSIVSLNGDGTVAGVSTTALPSECNFPGHAVFLDDPGNAVLVSCNGDGAATDPGGYVYLPDAF